MTLPMLDAMLWNGKWIVPIKAKILVGVEVIGSADELLQAVLAYVQNGDFKVLQASHGLGIRLM